jgi:hypothetical protein
MLRLPLFRPRQLAPGLLCLLLGCGASGPQDRFDRYLARLERTLDAAASKPIMAAIPPPPRPGSLRIIFEAGKLTALDFLALSGCALQVTIGKRNSSLGLMASDSQRLLLDLEYLQLAPDCVQYLRAGGQAALAVQLEREFELKRDQLPGRIFNATLGSDEYRQFWRPPYALATYPERTSSAVVTALAAINQAVGRWLAGDYRFDNMEFEILLNEVSAGDGGALLQALHLQSEWLAAADRMLADRLVRRQQTTFLRNEAEADILANVVARFFIAGIQPWSAGVERRRQSLLPEVQALEELLAATLPAHYRQWQQQRNHSLLTWSDAPRRHVQHLQAVQSALAQ